MAEHVCWVLECSLSFTMCATHKAFILSVIMLNVFMLSVIAPTFMLNILNDLFHCEACHYVECCFAECRITECAGASITIKMWWLWWMSWRWVPLYWVFYAECCSILKKPYCCYNNPFHRKLGNLSILKSAGNTEGSSDSFL